MHSDVNIVLVTPPQEMHLPFLGRGLSSWLWKHGREEITWPELVVLANDSAENSDLRRIIDEVGDRGGEVEAVSVFDW